MLSKEIEVQRDGIERHKIYKKYFDTLSYTHKL